MQRPNVAPDEAWTDLADGLRTAGRLLAESTAALDAAERADGYRALVRALNNLLSRLETDAECPELVAFNGWREKFFMDNPDYRYWITDVRDDRAYRITGNVGGSVYQSITVYTGTGIADAAAAARVDTDDLDVDDDGGFELILSNQSSGIGNGLALPAGATSVWVRFVHDDIKHDQAGWCRIDSLNDPAPSPAPAPSPDTCRFDRDLSRLGKFMSRLPQAFELAVAADAKSPNTVRHWAAMTGGAAFTEPGIHYLRGAWQLTAEEALVVEGELVACRHWNIVLYNRFLNSLDHRHRVVSRSAATSTVTDGRFRFVLCSRDPGVRGYDWLDTEGRTFGLFVMRFLQPDTTPALPDVRRVRLDDLGAPR
jgi:hypothetical protein